MVSLTVTLACCQPPLAQDVIFSLSVEITIGHSLGIFTLLALWDKIHPMQL